MSLLAIGLNHKTAPVDIRERITFGPDIIVGALRSLLEMPGVEEAVILSTCNRTEIYCGLAGAEQDEISLWLGNFHGLELETISPYLYRHEGKETIQHLLQVACGLDSMVLGEPQILGQMKSAYAVAEEAGTVGIEMMRLLPRVFAVAKKVRTDTAIGENPVSVAYAAVDLAGHIFSDLSKTRALLVGAGETIDLVARHLAETGIAQIVIANRTLGRARELAQHFGAEAVLLADIPEQLEYADIVISSTGSQLPILGKGAVEDALKLRKHRPILMIDLAVPRDI
jgi:glutamyl-tRNA reductase